MKLNIYLVTRPDGNYDEYRGFVIAATDEAMVRALVHAEADGQFTSGWSWDKATIELVGRGAKGVHAGVLLSDYKAG